MSTYSPDLRIELITTGDQAGTWGTTTNTNLAYVIEQAIAGYVSVAVSSANQALTYINGGSSTAALNQAVFANLALTTSTGANFAVYAPPASKQYTIYNASSYVATIYNSTVIGNTTAAGTGVAIPAGKTVTVWSDGTNFYFQNNHLSALTLTTDLALADGGTGASTAADARTNLGLGTMATQAANSVSITGGSITGITDLAVADGGTGASTAANARTNLGLVIGTDVQAYDAELTAIAALAVTDGNFIVGNGTTWVAESGATARTSLGLGTMATQASSSVSITGGSITGITDLAVADGGTGASDAAGARTNLGLGTMATQASSGVSITGGSITGITDLAVVDGGTGASSFTSGALLKGAGTSAVTVASSSDIVGQIGSTAVTNATNAANLVTGTFSIVQASGKLYFRYSGTDIASLDASGNFVSLADITAYGTP